MADEKTAVLEKPSVTPEEGTHIDRMSSSLGPAQKDSAEWFARTVAEQKESESSRDKWLRDGELPKAREVDLKEKSDQEKAWAEQVGEKVDSPKEKPNAKTEEKKPGSESSDSSVEPITADRYWQGKLEGKEHEAHWHQVESRAGVALAYIEQHPQKEQIVQGLQGLNVGRPPAFQRDFYTSLAMVPNPGEVLRHFALSKEDREFLRNCKNSNELKTAIQTVSKAYPVATKPKPRAPDPKPRAPKPPSEVGGRGSAMGDPAVDAAKDGDFRAFETAMNSRYHQK
jgi:hypothetical protein